MKTRILFLVAFLATNFAWAQVEFGPDVLGYSFESSTIVQANDYEGKVTCTLVHYKEQTRNYAAVLYIHGFNDYFFQQEMADQYHVHGISFFALDLRKYGRSWLPNQKLNNVRDLAEYDADIDTALKIMKQLGHTRILLAGHSTGGLIVSLYAAKNKGKENFDAVFCNSPFYDFNVPFLLKKIGVPFISGLGKNHPNKLNPNTINSLYDQSLLKSHYGEWEYDTTWKPIPAAPVNYGWIRAIHKGHKQVKKGLDIGKPILIMRSDKSIYEKKWSDKLFTGDAVLGVKDIQKGYEKMKAVKIELVEPNGIHDLILSKPEVRKKVYEDLFIWTEKYF
ncbi:MAG: alpha/beta hydrolase [Bacteroidetes bacterium B1(2017)]|nr:MAG: alpha/beta hydrolase [Bacteroidetes bacterium B1(2017)]